MNILIGKRGAQVQVIFENEADEEAIQINGQGVTIIGLDIDTTNPEFIEAITAAKNTWDAFNYKSGQEWMSADYDAKTAIKSAVAAMLS